jgi:hypothetical protein
MKPLRIKMSDQSPAPIRFESAEAAFLVPITTGAARMGGSCKIKN